MKVAIRVNGTVKATMVAAFGYQSSKTFTVKDKWLFHTPKVEPSTKPLYTYEVEKGNLLPDDFHVGGGSTKIKFFANLTGTVEIFQL